MTEPVRYSVAPVELPLEPWLLEGEPTDGCDVCMALARDRLNALRVGDQRAAYAASAELRACRHGGAR